MPEEYLLLIHKHLSHQTTRAEQKKLDCWLDESADHRQQFDELKALWESPDDYRPPDEDEHNIEKLALEARIHTMLPRASASSPRRPLLWSLAAALFLGLATGVIYWLRTSSGSLTSPVVRVSQQEGTQLTLPDSSIVRLEAQSDLSFLSNFDRRVVRLRGEAVFEVVPNATRPFLVIVPQATVRVVGTSFRVRAYPQEKKTIVVVVSGQVSVFNLYDTLLMNAGQQSMFDEQTRVWTVSEYIPSTNLKQGTNNLVFEGVSLKKILVTLEEHFDVAFVVENPSLLNCQFTGDFRQDQLHQMLEVLSFSLDFDYRYENHRYIIQGSGCP
jgi:ferric-dicitrate binding protein FerR (iron transport regulator)